MYPGKIGFIAENLWLGWVSCSLFPTEKSILTLEKSVAAVKSVPNATFSLIFLGLGWPWVGEFVDFTVIFTCFTTQQNLVYTRHREHPDERSFPFPREWIPRHRSCGYVFCVGYCGYSSIFPKLLIYMTQLLIWCSREYEYMYDSCFFHARSTVYVPIIAIIWLCTLYTFLLVSCFSFV